MTPTMCVLLGLGPSAPTPPLIPPATRECVVDPSLPPCEISSDPALWTPSPRPCPLPHPLFYSGMPTWKLMVMGAGDSLACSLGLMSGAWLSGPLIVILGQLIVPMVSTTPSPLRCGWLGQLWEQVQVGGGFKGLGRAGQQLAGLTARSLEGPRQAPAALSCLGALWRGLIPACFMFLSPPLLDLLRRLWGSFHGPPALGPESPYPWTPS